MTVQLEDQLIRDVDVARAYDIDRATVWRWVKAGRIPPPAVSRDKFTRWHKSVIMEAVRKIGEAERAEAAS